MALSSLGHEQASGGDGRGAADTVAATNVRLAATLREAREAIGLSRSALARLAGTQQSQVSVLESRADACVDSDLADSLGASVATVARLGDLLGYDLTLTPRRPVGPQVDEAVEALRRAHAAMPDAIVDLAHGRWGDASKSLTTLADAVAVARHALRTTPRGGAR